MNQVVGGAQDGAGRTVVLLQFDHLELGKVLRQPAQIVQRGAAPSINRLVIVAHGRQPSIGSMCLIDQEFEQFVLRGVRVLILIHQHMTQQALPMLPHRLMITQQLQG